MREQFERARVENPILTGMIVSTPYLQRVRNWYNKEYFQQEYARRISQWCVDYYDTRHAAPGENIKAVFKIESAKMKPDDIELCSIYLDSIAAEFEPVNFNVEYLVDETRKYFEERELYTRAEHVLRFIDAGRPDDARLEIEGYKTIWDEIDDGVNVFSPDFVQDIWKTGLDPDLEKPERALFMMPGALGDLMGWIQRETLTAFVAPAKRGKSFFLQALALRAALTYRINVVYFALEMSLKLQGQRLIQGITAMGPKSQYAYPAFDCYWNQCDECRHPERRTNPRGVRINVGAKRGRLPKLETAKEINEFVFENTGYKVCTACRDTKDRKDYEKEVWWRAVKPEPLTEVNLVQKVQSQAMFGGLLWLKSCGTKTSTLASMWQYINSVEFATGKTFDLIVIDYADIIGKAGNNYTNDILDQTNTWNYMHSLAIDKHAAIITATQGTKKSEDKENLRATDASWSYGKVAAVDSIYVLNQTEKEKRRGILRVAKPTERSGSSDAFDEVTVLQNLELAQVVYEVDRGRVDYDHKEEDDHID